MLFLLGFLLPDDELLLDLKEARSPVLLVVLSLLPLGLDFLVEGADEFVLVLEVQLQLEGLAVQLKKLAKIYHLVQLDVIGRGQCLAEVRDVN